MRSLHRFINLKGRIEAEEVEDAEFYLDYRSKKDRRQRVTEMTSYAIHKLYERRKKKRSFELLPLKFLGRKMVKMKEV